MQNTISLNDHYAHYSIGALGREELEVLIFETIRKEVRSIKLPIWEAEDYDDYISWLYPRICKSIDAYRETGSSFENYIGNLVRLTVKEYRNRQVRDYINETVAWNIGSADMFVSENTIEYDEDISTENTEEINGAEKNPRQLLILVLKCCNFVSADFLKKVSPRLGIEEDVLENMINSLKNDSVMRIKNRELLQEKINRQFCRCLVYERTFLSITDETVFQRQKRKLELGRNRLIKLRIKHAKMRTDPSNFQIAQLLGISKGTVDAVLYTLKTRWKNNLENTLDNNMLN